MTSQKRPHPCLCDPSGSHSHLRRNWKWHGKNSAAARSLCPHIEHWVAAWLDKKPAKQDFFGQWGMLPEDLPNPSYTSDHIWLNILKSNTKEKSLWIETLGPFCSHQDSWEIWTSIPWPPWPIPKKRDWKWTPLALQQPQLGGPIPASPRRPPWTLHRIAPRSGRWTPHNPWRHSGIEPDILAQKGWMKGTSTGKNGENYHQISGRCFLSSESESANQSYWSSWLLVKYMDKWILRHKFT